MFALDPPGVAGGADFSFINRDPAKATRPSTCFATSCWPWRAGHPIRRHFLGRRLPDRFDAELRGQLLAAFQGVEARHAIPGNHDCTTRSRPSWRHFWSQTPHALRCAREADLRLTSTTTRARR
jgi:hypothetical protein